MIYKQPENTSLYFIQQNIVRVLFGIIIFPISNIQREKLLKIFIKNLKIFSNFLLIIFMIKFILILLNDTRITGIIYWYGRENSIFWFQSTKYFGILIPEIFSGNIIFLVFLQAYSLFEEKNLKYSILASFLLFQSGTSANILSALLILGYFLYSEFLKNINFRIVSLLKFLLFGLLGTIGIIIFKNIIFNNNDGGNQIKYLHMISYFKLWNTKPFLLFLGQGLGAGFFSEGRNTILYLTEIFYFEIVRIYGFLFFILILIILLLLVYKSILKKKEWLAISFLSYLFISGTNPYLFGIGGTFIVIVVYSLLKDKKFMTLVTK